MTRGRIITAGIIAWVLILGIALQPHAPRTPSVTHAHRLDRPEHDLPTLPPQRL